MADQEALIAQFMEITGVNRERAEFFVNASNSQLDVALSSFYEEAVEAPSEENRPTAMERDSDSSDDIEEIPQKKPSQTKQKSGYGNVATMSSVRDTEPREDDGQAYYAGGSEHSGQQVLGPPRKKNPVKDIVADVFRKAQSGNAEQFDNTDETRFLKFEGTGYKLGQNEEDSVAVPSSSSSRKKHDECDTVTVKVYQQGFTLNDGEIRPYEDPRNREFFESITRNEIPAELRKQGKAMVHVNVENHLEEEYIKKTPKFAAFTGSGHTLGSPAPEVKSESSNSASAAASTASTSSESNAVNEARAIADLNVNESEPSTMISIRLTDGSRISTRFNLTHTVQDIRQFIISSRPENEGRNFTLLTTFPNKELINSTDTIKQAGLQNAAILQRAK